MCSGGYLIWIIEVNAQFPVSHTVPLPPLRQFQSPMTNSLQFRIFHVIQRIDVERLITDTSTEEMLIRT